MKLDWALPCALHNIHFDLRLSVAEWGNNRKEKEELCSRQWEYFQHHIDEMGFSWARCQLRQKNEAKRRNGVVGQKGSVLHGNPSDIRLSERAHKVECVITERV
eukprot:scaffold25031_cov15-Tisochrysis_lutea.AAC.1